MESQHSENIQRLTGFVEDLIHELTNDQRIVVHDKIDQFYYMQKAEELKLLHAQLEEACNRLENTRLRANQHYREIFCQWRQDVRWINQFKIRAKRKI